ncbi:MAG: transglutaminase family protein [Polyangia bacterium]
MNAGSRLRPTRPRHWLMAVVATAGAASAGSCRRGTRQADGVPGPVASALLAFAAEQGIPPREVANSWAALQAIAERVQARQRAAGDDSLDALNHVIFGGGEEVPDGTGFAREIDRDELRFLLLPSVVQERRGGCVGLSGLYLALGERLDIPLSGILVPGHFFVRAAGARPRNAELLRRGEAMPDQWYRKKYGPWDDATSAYLRPLTLDEVMAVHWFNAGNQRRDAGDLPAAARAYRRALDDFPAFAEAAASLGAVEQLQGDLAGAANAYRAAARARPDLPGLARNLSVLQAERDNAAPASRTTAGELAPRRSPSPPAPQTH